MFLNALEKQILDDHNISITENGAVGYRTTGKALLDMNFKVTSMRNMKDRQIIDLFNNAWAENKELALKWLFYLRDVRGGLGERRSFRVILKSIADELSDATMEHLLPLIMEYGRADDICVLLDTNRRTMVAKFCRQTLRDDWRKMEKGESISLMAKWLPTGRRGKKNPEKKRWAQILRDEWGMNVGDYRRSLSKLKRYLDLVEYKMTNNEWSGIDYKTVPSGANLKYNKAFLRHDEARRRKFLEAVMKGEQKMNASVLFPHDIVHQYGVSRYGTTQINQSLEAMWKSLKSVEAPNTIVVADGSGSMTSRVGNTNVSALTVANALAIYFAERLQNEFKNAYITFSRTPQLVKFGEGTSLKQKLEIALEHDEVANTNIEAVFDLILNTAVRNHMTQEELPKSILILSDCEFDCMVESGRRRGYGYEPVSANLFKEIAKKYAACGYKLPKLIFWNLISRTGTIPVRENEMGVALISGFSPNTIKMVMNEEIDPYKALLGVILSERYAPVVLKN